MRWQQGPRQRDATTSWRASLCQQASSINGSLMTVSHKAINDHGRPKTSLVIEDEASMRVSMRIFL